jgi:hypothetical protein
MKTGLVGNKVCVDDNFSSLAYFELLMKFLTRLRKSFSSMTRELCFQNFDIDLRTVHYEIGTTLKWYNF